MNLRKSARDDVNPTGHLVAEGLVSALALYAFLWGWRADLVWCERHLLLWYSANNDHDRGVAVAWRVAAIAVGSILLLIVRPPLARWAGARSARESLLVVARLAIALAGALIVGEGACRWLHLPKDPVSRQFIETRIGQADPRYGWVYAGPRATVVGDSGRPVEYAINAAHNRARSVDDAPVRSAPTIFFLGESIMEGHGLLWDETIAARVGAALQLQVVNLAVDRYAVDQAFLRFADELPKFEHPVAVVSLYIPPLIERLYRHDHPRLVFTGDHFDLVPSTSFWDRLHLVQLQERLFEYHRDTELDLAAKVYRETARLAENRGAAALFLAPGIGYPLPRGDDYLIDEFFRKQGLHCIEDDVGFNPLPDDPAHLNAEGARRVAALTIRALRELLRLPDTTPSSCTSLDDQH